MVKLTSINPSTYKPLGEVEISSNAEITEKVALAREALQNWHEIGLQKRIEFLKKAFAEFETRKEELALLQTREMGRPINETLGGIDDDFYYANWYMDNAEKYS